MATSTIKKAVLSLVTTWTNSDPSQAFTSQTVNIGITNAKGVTIEFREHSTATRLFSLTLMSDTFVNGKLDGFTYTNQPYVYYLRPFSFDPVDGTVTFASAYPMTAYGTYGTVNNLYAVPYRIIAIY